MLAKLIHMMDDSIAKEQNYESPLTLFSRSDVRTALLYYAAALLVIIVLAFAYSTHCSYPLFHRDLGNALCGPAPGNPKTVPTRRRQLPFTPVSASPMRDDYLTLAQHDGRL